MANLLLFNRNVKICSTCKKELDLNEFTKNSALKDKLQNNCRYCDNVRQQKRRANNKEELKEYSIKYRERKRNDFTWRLQQLLSSSRQRSIQKNRKHTLTIDDLKNIYPKDGLCPVFGFKLEWNSAGFRETSPSIDRIDSNKGYTLDNVQIISWKANRIKSYATLEDLEIVISYMKSGG